MDAKSMITTASELVQVCDAIRQSDWVGLDTEFLRTQTYFPRLCLIQLSTSDGQFCIDPLAIEDLGPLNALLQNSDIVKIIHSSRQDLEALDLRLSDPLCNLYDTQIAAAFCSVESQVSYAFLVDKVCNVRLDKAHTRTDWHVRPLSVAQLHYAIDDVRYLGQLKHYFDQKLREVGRLEWHRQECELASAPQTYRINPSDAWMRLKGGASLETRYQSCAKALAIWRERRAQQKNRPREWILPSRVLLEICKRCPRTERQLARIDGMGDTRAQRMGSEIIELVRRHADAAETMPVWPNHRLSRDKRKQASEIMKLLKSTAETMSLCQSLLANRLDVEMFIGGERDLPLFRGWRRALIGGEILTRYA